MHPAGPSPAQRVAHLAPRWHERVGEAALRRRLPQDTVEELFDHGLLDIVAPRRHGGLQLGWPDLVQAARLAARTCPSTAWTIALVGGHAALAARLPTRCQEEMYAVPGPLLIASASVSADAQVKACEGGYRVSGRWRFCSGVSFARWVMLSARWPCGGDAAGTPEMQMLVLEASQLRLHEEAWMTTGMRGTGSFDVEVQQAFVPAHRSLAWKDLLAAEPPGAGRHPGHYLSQVPVLPYVSSWVVGPILGCAEGAYDAYLQGARGYKDARTGTPLSEMPLVQERLAESAAELRCARLLLIAMSDVLHTAGTRGDALTPAQGRTVRRDAGYLAELCRRAIDRLVRHAGSGVYFDGHALNRRWNDLQAMVAHADVQWDGAMRSYGESELKGEDNRSGDRA
jgi:3-hydroxy-9,10-secoandrosta-1,3,5(10)-triene-9,17-dione monooxygenase